MVNFLDLDQRFEVAEVAVARTNVKSILKSHELVVLALYKSGGARGEVDTEDVAMKASELFPGRFSWRKYPDQVNLEAVRVFLSDAKKAKCGNLVVGSGRSGWRLTSAGLAFCKRTAVPRKAVATAPGGNDRHATWRRAERKRLLASDAYQLSSRHQHSAITAQMVDEFFRIDAYSDAATCERKVIRILDEFGDDPELGSVVRGLVQVRRGGSHG